jgi:hypothetical protein
VEVSGHPDLIHLGRMLRDRMDRTLEAEMEAARAAARRTRTLRDLLLSAEDAAARIYLTASDGSLHSGVVAAVGADHVEINASGVPHIVALGHVVAVEVRQ